MSLQEIRAVFEFLFILPQYYVRGFSLKIDRGSGTPGSGGDVTGGGGGGPRSGDVW